MMRLNFYGIFIATALFVTGCNNSHEHDHAHIHQDSHKHSDKEGHNHADEIVFTTCQAKAAGLKTETVAASAFHNVIKSSGQILASQGDEQTVVATSAGTVSFAGSSIVDGTPVGKGETIVTISANNLQEGDPALKAKVAFEVAEKEFRRAEGLVAEKIISDKEFEQIRLNYETAKAAFQGLSANVGESGVRVPSPMKGYIKNRLVAQGDYVSVGQPIVTVAQNRRLQLRAEVSERYFKQLKNISTANFKTAYDDVTYELSKMNGKLLSYGKASSGSSFYIPVTFEFDNVGDIIPGSFAEMYLLASQRDNVISVPVTALTDEQGLNFVYVQTGSEHFVKKEVMLGENNGERVEIIKGLHVGDKVVTNGVIQVKLASVSGAIPHGHNH